VGKVHELQAEDPARSRRRVSPFVLVLGVAAAFCGALALSALFAHPAGASTLPGPGGTPPIAMVSNGAQPAVSSLPAVVDSDVDSAFATLGSSAAATPVSSLRQVAPLFTLRALTPLVEPIAQSLGTSIGLAVQTAAPAPAVVPSTVFQLDSMAAPLRAVPATSAPATRLLRATSGTPENLPALGLFPRSPGPIPPPTPPIQRFPLVAGSSPAGDSSSSSYGSNALSVVPASSSLLPAPRVSGITLEQSVLPRFLFDMRCSPPG
jgi:hypothetical protein